MTNRFSSYLQFISVPTTNCVNVQTLFLDFGFTSRDISRPVLIVFNHYGCPKKLQIFPMYKKSIPG